MIVGLTEEEEPSLSMREIVTGLNLMMGIGTWKSYYTNPPYYQIVETCQLEFFE